MSYILEALKKSEARRRLGQTPDITEDARHGHRRSRRWRLLLLAVLAAGAGGAGGLWLSSAREPPAPGGPTMAATGPRNAAVPAPPSGGPPAAAANARPAPPAGGGGTAHTAAADPATALPGTGHQDAPPVADLANATPPATPETTPATGTAADADDPAWLAREARELASAERADPPASAQPATRDRAPSPLEALTAAAAERENRRHQPPPETTGPTPLSAMPWGFRSQLPALALNVHVYAAEAEDRFVLINMRRYREGEFLDEGDLRVVKIVPNGVVLSQGGEEFLLQP